MHIVEEGTGWLEGLPHFEVRLFAFITNTSDNNAFKMILQSSKQLFHHLSAQSNTFLFRQERSSHAAVVVDGEEDIIILGGGGSQTTGEIVKSE